MTTIELSGPDAQRLALILEPYLRWVERSAAIPLHLVIQAQDIDMTIMEDTHADK